MSPTGKSYSFRSCVRACERARRGEAKLCAPVRRCCFRGWVAGAEFELRCAVARGVACPHFLFVVRRICLFVKFVG